MLDKKQQNKVEDRLIEIGIKHKQKQLREKSKLKAEENAKLKYHPQLEEKTKQIANKKHKHRLNEIPTSIPGINPEYVVYPRNKSADLFRNALKRNQYKNNSSINNNNNSYLNSDNKNELYSNQSFGNIQTEIISTISNNTKNNIKQMGKAVIFEAEKSVLKAQSYFGFNNDIYVACCGSSLTAYQVQLLLDNGAKEICIAYDRQFQEIGDKEFLHLKANLMKLYNKYKNYATISFIFDKEMITDYKASPIDEGKDKFLKLFKERIIL